MRLYSLVGPLLLASVVTFAQDKSPTEIPSIIYLQYLNQNAPQWMCQQDATFSCLGIPAMVCVKGVEAAAERCGPALLAQWPTSFPETRENALEYSAQYRQCILEDWITQQWITPEQLNQCEPNNSL
ncbi:hypothetical protein [Reinekea sp.]|jgi:hypothetical protein|uniref:hypothetical protein n=1 Tax=Reinekea sp. TaxID=1970455 RepID=UPI003989CBD8